MSIEPIVDLRSDFGHYSRRGDDDSTDYRNYWRLGPRAGFSVTSENAYIPLQLTVTDVFLEGLTGNLPHINYFKADVELQDRWQVHQLGSWLQPRAS